MENAFFETDATFDSIHTMPIDFLHAVLNKVKKPPLKPQWQPKTLAVIRTLQGHCLADFAGVSHPSAEIMWEFDL